MDNKTIIEQIKKGDKETIQAVYKQYAVDVYKFSKNITHDHDLAMKATEQTFLDLFKSIQKGESAPDDLRREALKTTYIKAQAIMAEKAAEEEAKKEVPAEEPVPAKEETAAEEAVVKTKEEAPSEPAAVPEVSEEKEEPAAEESVAEETQDVQETEDPDNDDLKIEFPEGEKYEADEEEGDPVSETRVIDISEAPEEGDRIFKEDEEAEIRERYYTEDEEEEEVKSNKGLFVFLVVINVILILLLLWLLVGLLVNLEVLPESVDLGYTWFNNHIYPIF